jgi:uncharacterized protein YehS (DUF1456 family)
MVREEKTRFTKEHEKLFCVDNHNNYLYCGDRFLGVQLCQELPNFGAGDVTQ